MEVGEEGERKGEVNRSEVKWNANAACPAEEEKRELALASSSCVVSRRGEERRGERPAAVGDFCRGSVRLVRSD